MNKIALLFLDQINHHFLIVLPLHLQLKDGTSQIQSYYYFFLDAMLSKVPDSRSLNPQQQDLTLQQQHIAFLHVNYILEKFGLIPLKEM